MTASETDTRTHLVCDDTQREGVVRLLHEAGVPFLEAGWTSNWARDLRVGQRQVDMRVVAISDPGGTPDDYSRAIAAGEPYRNPKHQAFLRRTAAERQTSPSSDTDRSTK